jgi:hypothetical protein
MEDSVMKADPYVMKPVRVAEVHVIGRMWMPSELGATTYQLTDADLTTIDDFTRDNVSKWLTAKAGDFQSITDFYAVCGSVEVPWSDPKNDEVCYNIMFGYQEQEEET